MLTAHIRACEATGTLPFHLGRGVEGASCPTPWLAAGLCCPRGEPALRRLEHALIREAIWAWKSEAHVLIPNVFLNHIRSTAREEAKPGSRHHWSGSEKAQLLAAGRPGEGPGQACWQQPLLLPPSRETFAELVGHGRHPEKKKKCIGGRGGSLNSPGAVSSGNRRGRFRRVLASGQEEPFSTEAATAKAEPHQRRQSEVSVLV